MSIRTVPSRDFGRDVGRAKRLAAEGPVLITDRGKPAFALLKIEDYYKLCGGPREIMDSMSRTEGIEISPPRADISLQPQ